LLMGAKLEQDLRCVWDYYSRKGSPQEPHVPLMKLVYYLIGIRVSAGSVSTMCGGREP
jgi:hypothetical protein